MAEPLQTGKSPRGEIVPEGHHAVKESFATRDSECLLLVIDPSGNPEIQPSSGKVRITGKPEVTARNVRNADHTAGSVRICWAESIHHRESTEPLPQTYSHWVIVNRQSKVHHT